MDVYNDGKVECLPEELRLRGYYFPWGTKRIPYSAIRSVRRVEMDALRGRARIWGTANPGLWANLDPGRPKKKVALVIDLGGSVKPFVTPDHPDAVLDIINERAHLDSGGGPAARGPLI